MYTVIKKGKYGFSQPVKTFKKKAQAKSWIAKNSGGLNMGYWFEVKI